MIPEALLQNYVHDSVRELLLPAVWRFFTGPILHGGLLHVVLNMLAFVPLASSAEAHLGSTLFCHLMFVLTLVTGVIFVLIAYALALR